MKAPAHPGGVAPPRVRPAAGHRWRRMLLRAIGLVVAVLALLAAMAWLDQAEGDLRLVQAPSSSPSFAPSAFAPSATTLS